MSQHAWRKPPSSSTFSYIDEIQHTLVELDKAIKNIEMMARTAKKLGIPELLQSPGTFWQQSQANWQNIMQNIDLQQLKALINSPVLRKILTDPEFYQLFAPDTGKPPGTGTTSNHHEVNRDEHP